MNRKQLFALLTEFLSAQDIVTDRNVRLSRILTADRRTEMGAEVAAAQVQREHLRSQILASFSALEQRRDDLLAALDALAHADGCHCEAAWAPLGCHVGHTDECLAAKDAIAAVKGDA